MNNLDSFDSFIFNNISKLRSKTNLYIFNLVTNNDDIVNICPNLYLGNYKSSQSLKILKNYNINSIVNCTKDIPFSEYFKHRNYLRIDVEDSRDINNINDFKSKIIDATIFINNEINNNNNVLVHCYWGIMRSPTVVASYLMFKYKMYVEAVIELIKDKKNCSFHNIYNFKEILNYVHEEVKKFYNK